MAYETLLDTYGSGPPGDIPDGNYRAYHRDSLIASIDTVANFRLKDWNLQKRVFVEERGAVYSYLPASSDADDGVSRLRDVNDRVYGFVRFGRELLAADRTYYVDPTNGSDSNDGLSSGAGAFATPQHALDVVLGTLDLGGYDVDIQLADDTYTGGIVMASAQVGAGLISIKGNASTPANVDWHVTNNNIVYLSGAAARLHVQDVKLRTTTGGSCLVTFAPGALLTFSNLEFGACAANHISATGLSTIQCTGNYTISGNANVHALSTNARLLVTGVTVTLTGTPAFSSAYAYAQSLGYCQLNGCTFTGSATGTRYVAYTNSVIQTFGGGATYLPGDSAGTTGSGGQYA